MTKFKLLAREGKIETNTFEIDGDDIKFFGNIDGSMDVKFNRASKIASRYNEIVAKLENIISENKDIFPVNKQYCLATSLLLILQTGIRIGNEESSEGYWTVPMPHSKIKPQFVKTYGLTTMLREHTTVNRTTGQVFFKFLGKKHVVNVFTLDKHLSKYVQRIEESKYSPLFNITEGELTSFIKRETSPYFSAKDFRTFRANVYAYKAIRSMPIPTNKKEYKQSITKVAESVSIKLNNTPNVCKKSYIDPSLFVKTFGPLPK